MAPADFTSAGPSRQPPAFPDLAEEREILDNVNLEPLIDAVLRPYASVSRRPHDRRAVVRAHFMAYLHKTVIGTITAPHWTLLNNATSRVACGFKGRVPSRPTLSRVFTQMAEHIELVERIMDEVVREAKRIHPDLGEELAVDSTPVRSYSDGNRKPRSDPDAEWGMHHKANTKEGFEWVFGYKLHVPADANYDFPIAMKFTPGNANDSPHLIPLVEDAERRLNGFPERFLADRGYDAERNSTWVDSGAALRSFTSESRRAGFTRVSTPRTGFRSASAGRSGSICSPTPPTAFTTMDAPRTVTLTTRTRCAT